MPMFREIFFKLLLKFDIGCDGVLSGDLNQFQDELRYCTTIRFINKEVLDPRLLTQRTCFIKFVAQRIDAC